MPKANKWLECVSCEAMFTVKHSMDVEFYTVEHCPFCGDELDIEVGLEYDDEEEDYE